jgi:hypothetical protein
VEESFERVEFVTLAAPSPGQVQLHGVGERLTRTLTEVKQNWRLVVGQVAAIVDAGSGTSFPEGIALREVEVSLGFDARGRLAFIADAGVQATIVVRFDVRRARADSMPPGEDQSTDY